MAAAGFNSDVSFDGLVLHVQTEDLGGGNPVFETLVYCGGQILHQERTTYGSLLEEGLPEAEIAARLERQHQDLIRRARHGEFLPGRRPTLAAGPPGAADAWAELLGGALAHPELAPLILTFCPAPGGGGLLGQLGVRRSDEDELVENVDVNGSLVGAQRDPAPVWSGRTGADGVALVAAELPSGAAGAVIFRAQHEGHTGRLRVELPAEETRRGRRRVSAGEPAPPEAPAPGSSS